MRSGKYIIQQDG